MDITGGNLWHAGEMLENITRWTSIHSPETSPSPSESSSVTIYLPRGPILGNEAQDASNLSILRNTVPGHIVQINYRCSKTYQFPTPIHDVLSGYNWITSNLLPKRAITRPGRSEHVGKLAVYGELLGGGLATALALTECRAGEPGIVAAAVNNPIVNWVDLNEASDMPLTKEEMNPISTGLTWEALVKHRDALFRKPEHYFDPFASPILFFRSAGFEVPIHVEKRPLNEMEELIRFEREESLREQLAVGAQPDVPEADEVPATRKRRVSRRFPSKALGLRLPCFRIDSGEKCVLSEQATELVHQLRQSYERQSKPGPSRARSVAYDQSFNLSTEEDMVRHGWNAGLGLCDDSEAGKARMLQAARWIGDALAR